MSIVMNPRPRNYAVIDTNQPVSVMPAKKSQNYVNKIAELVGCDPGSIYVTLGEPEIELPDISKIKYRRIKKDK